MEQYDNKKIKPEDHLRVKFEKILLDDIFVACRRLEENDRQTHKRELIRSIFAGIEGLIWIYKEYVKSIALKIDIIDPVTTLAIDEKEYNISDKGVLRLKDNYIAAITMFRFISRIAKKINPQLEIDFNNDG